MQTNIGLGLTAPSRSLVGWWHPKTVWAADFFNGRAMQSGQLNRLDEMATVTRSSPHMLIGADGVVRTFGPDQLARLDSVGAYIGGQATNLWLNSSDMSAASFVKQRATIVPNVERAPDGTMTADKMVEDTTLGEHGFYSIPTYTLDAVGIASVFAKPAGREWIFFSSNGRSAVKFHLAGTGAAAIMPASSGINAFDFGIIPVANGYYFCWAKFAEGRSGQGKLWRLARTDPGTDIGHAYTGDGESGAYFWQYDFKHQSAITPPILSGATAATRLASDVSAASLDWFAAAGLQAGFSVLATINLSHMGEGASRMLFSINNGTTGNATRVYVDAGGALQMASSRDGAVEFAGQTLPVTLGRQKIAFRLDGTGGVMKSKAGAASSTTLPLPNGPTTLSIGSQLAAGYLNDLIERIEVCRPLTDGEMDAWVAA